MKIIDPMLFYNYIITNEGYNNDFSLAAHNTELDASGNLKNILDLTIFNQTGEWLENQTNTMNTQHDDSEASYGNFRYLSTVVNEQAMFPQYMEVFDLQVIVPEKFREKAIKMFDNFALAINNYEDEIVLEDDSKEKSFDILIQLGDLTTPDYSEKQDIGGMERFIITMNFVVTVTTSIVTNKKIKLFYLNTRDFEDEIKYTNLKIQRQNELVLDNRAGNEKLYDSNKSDFTITISALYTGSDFSRAVMKYIMFPDKLNTPATIHYRDESSPVIGQNINDVDVHEIENTFEMFISSADIQYQFGQPVSYSVSLKNKLED